MKLKIKKGDNVIVVAGRDKNTIGEVYKAFPKDNKVLVRGVNVVKKHKKPTQTEPGGIISKELPIHVSNVAIVDPKTNKATRVGYKVLEDGKKVRFAKASGEILDK